MVDTRNLHSILGERPGLIKADGLEPGALDCLFWLGAHDAIFVKPHKAETIG